MSSVPTMDNKAFKHLSHGAQALWFHLAMRAREEDGRLSVSETEAAALRRELVIDDEAVRALLRNGFITAESGRVYVTEESVWMPGPIVERDGEQQVLFVYPGSRLVICRESIEKYRREQARAEQVRREKYGYDHI